MSADRLCIDLCCGRKGFSRAFSEAGWEVVTVDIDPKFEPTICADITKLAVEDIWRVTNWRGFKKTVVLASPPCERFSIANSHWPQRGVGKALAIVGACLELIIDIRPDYWALENPRGRLAWFLGAPPNSVKLKNYGLRHSIGGRPSKPSKPTDIWGNIPFEMLKADVDLPKSANKIRDPSIRADMSYLSRPILTAIEPTDTKDGGIGGR